MALPATIKLRWNWMAEEDILAYYCTATNTAVKSIIVQAPGDDFTTFYVLCNIQMGQVSKSFCSWQAFQT
jgi:hypothetical protein